MSKHRNSYVYLLLALAFALRAYNLGGPELWFDEAASYFIASKSWLGILQYVAGAPFEHPPFYYLLLHAFIELVGTSEWALRFPSLIVSTLLVAGIYRATKTIFSHRLALATAAVTAFSPFFITYAQEARMYALMQMLGLLATYLLYSGYKSRSWSTWATYIVTIGLGLLTHYFFVFLLVAHAIILYVLGGGTLRQLRHVVLTVCAPIIAALTWFALAAGPRAAAEKMLSQALWGKSWEAIGRLFLTWTYGGAIIAERASWVWLPAVAIAIIACLGLLYRGFDRITRMVLPIWLLVPAMIAIIIPYGGLELRHFSYVAPAIALLTAAGTLWLWEGKAWLGVVSLIPLTAVIIVGLPRQYALEKGSYGEAAAHIEHYSGPGDFILLANPHQWVLASYYLPRGIPTAGIGDQVSSPTEQVEQASRVWVLGWETWGLTNSEGIGDFLAGQDLYPAYNLDYPNSVSLSLWYPKPAAMPATGFSGRWGSDSSIIEIATSATTPSPGEAVLAEVRWTAPPERAERTAFILRLSDGDGRVWAEAAFVPDIRRQMDADTGELSTRGALVIPGGTPPGIYALEIAAVDLNTDSLFTTFDNTGLALGPWLSLVPVNVLRGTFPPPAPAVPASLVIGSSLVYSGSETDRTVLTAGETWSGMLQFQARQKPEAATLSLSVAGKSGETRLAEMPLVAGTLGAEQWNEGESWRCPVSVKLPPSLPTGEYRLVARVFVNGVVQPVKPVTGNILARTRDSFALDSFLVQARERQMAAAKPQEAMSASFGGQVELYGYDFAISGDVINLRLYWRSLSPTVEPQKVFLHLAPIDQAQPTEQDDAPPASMPTTDWLPGEEFVSEHHLSLEKVSDPATYVVRIGLYNDHTMERLPASGDLAATDRIEIALASLIARARP